jgi:hypothetical protein
VHRGPFVKNKERIAAMLSDGRFVTKTLQSTLWKSFPGSKLPSTPPYAILCFEEHKISTTLIDVVWKACAVTYI